MPITRNANTFYSSGYLLASEHVHSRIVEVPKEEIIEYERLNTNGNHIPLTLYTEGIKQYILSESFYQILKYSKEQYGKISHFN